MAVSRERARAVVAAIGMTLALCATAGAQQPEQQLSEVRVRASADARTEDTGSYTTRRLTVDKTDAELRELPRSASVLTRQRLDDQNLTKLEDAMKLTTGITVTRFDGAGNFNTISARGFDIGAVQLDGLPISQGGNFATALDVAIYDRIEVLRGPAGLLQGAGEPGGTINLVRKRAREGLRLGGAIGLGSWDAYRAEVDVTGPLVASGRVRGRFVGVADDRNSFVDVIETRKRVGYGTLEADLTRSTTLSVGATRQEIDSVIDQGLPAFANGRLLDVGRNTMIGARWNSQTPDTTDAFAELEHRFDGGGFFKLSGRHVDRKMLYRVARANGAVDPITGNVAIQTVSLDLESKNDLLDAHVVLPFQLWGQKQVFLLGAGHSEEDSRNRSVFGPNFVMNVFSPNHDIPEQPLTLPEFTSKTVQTQQGMYVQARVKPIESLTAVLAGRLDWWETENRRLSDDAVTASSKPGRQFTPFTGLIFDLNERVSTYVSYAEGFVAQAVTTVNGTLLPPRTSKQVEAGVKAELMASRLNTHLAIFRILDKNRALADPDNPGFSLAGGEVRSQGLEAEVSGQVMPGWDVVAGYAYTDTKIVRAAIDQQGQPFSTVTPKHNLTLWTRYQLRGTEWERWSVGAGVKAVSDFFAQAGTVRFVADSYATVMAQIGYRITDKLSATLTVNNVFDSVYYEKVSSSLRQNFYGEPRSVTLVLRGQL